MIGVCYLSVNFGLMADEDSVLEEAMDSPKEAGQRIRATQSLMRSQGIEVYRDPLTRLSGKDHTGTRWA